MSNEDVYVVRAIGDSERAFKGADAREQAYSHLESCLEKGYETTIAKRPELSGRNRSHFDRLDSEELLQRAWSGIEEIPVRADLLVELINRLHSAEGASYIKFAPRRDEPLGEREPDSGWADLNGLERVGREYYGREHSNLLGTAWILRKAAEAAGEEDYEECARLVLNLVGGYDKPVTDRETVRHLIEKLDTKFKMERDRISIASTTGPGRITFYFSEGGRLTDLDVVQPGSLDS